VQVYNLSDGNPADDLARKIRRAEVALGDLSTVEANITLPVSDSTVNVTWSSSNTSALSNTGTVTRPPSGDGHTEVTLTGTFTSVFDPNTTEDKEWDVRVMREGALAVEFLNVHYSVVFDEEAAAKVLKNIAYSGKYYVPKLMGDAKLENKTGTRANSDQYSYDYINVGDNGYIDLGEKIGALLRNKPEWTVEFHARIPVNNGTMFGVANQHPSTSLGSIILNNEALMLRAIASGTTGANSGSNTMNNNVSVTGNSGGLGSFTGAVNGNNGAQWVQLGIIRRPDSYVTTYTNAPTDGRLYGTMRTIRNWGRAQNDRHVDYRKINDNPNFGSVNDETYPMPYAYIGRNMVTGVTGGTNTQATGLNSGTPNAFYWEIKVYSKALSLSDDAYPDPSLSDRTNSAASTVYRDAQRAIKGQMNTDFGYPNTN
jgi:hypothetical protein